MSKSELRRKKRFWHSFKGAIKSPANTTTLATKAKIVHKKYGSGSRRNTICTFAIEYE